MSHQPTTTTNPDEKETTKPKHGIGFVGNEHKYLRGVGKEFDNVLARKFCDCVSADRAEIINLINNLPCLINLKRLLIKHADIGDEGLTALASQEVVLKRLVILSLWGSDFTDDGFKEFTHSFHLMKKMKYLYLTQTPIADKGATAFAENMSHLESLEILYLNGTKIGLEGLDAIIENLNSIRSLEKACLMSNHPDADSILKEKIDKVRDSINVNVSHYNDDYLFEKRDVIHSQMEEEKVYESDDE